MKTPFRHSLLGAACALSLMLGVGGVAHAQTYQLQKHVPSLKVDPTQVARVGVSAASVALDNVLIGTSRTETVLIYNTGLANLTGLRNVQVSGAGFTGSTSCGQTLTPGASCAVNVVFSPVAATSYSGQLSFQTDLSPAAVTVPLSGTGLNLSGSLVANAGTNFGNVLVGESNVLDFMFSNTGSVSYTSLRPVLQGTGLSILSSTCGTAASPITLSSASGQNTCQISVRYAPAAAGTLSSASLRIVSDQFSSNTLALSGFAPAPSATLAANTNAAFGSVNLNTTVSRTFTYTNTGNVSLTGVKASLAGGSTLALSANTCGTESSPVTVSSTAGSNTCSVTVTYTPTEGKALVNAAVSVASNEVAAKSVALSGSGNAPYVQWEDVASSAVITSWDAGSYAMGGGGVTKDFRIRNGGVTNLVFTANPFTTNVAGPFYVYSTTCKSATLAPNATCNVTLQFAPTATGSVSRTLTANTNQTGALTLAMTGTGTAESQQTLILLDGEGANSGSVFTNRGLGDITVSRTGTSVYTYTSVKKFGTASIRFSNRNSGEYLQTTNDARLDLGTADFTMEWWQYRTWYGNTNWDQFTSPVSSYDFMVGHNRWGYVDPGISFCVSGISGNCGAYASTLSTGTPNPITTLNTWHHVAVTRQGATYRLYVNGTRYSEWTDSRVYSIGANANNNWAFGTATFEGYLDDIRVIKGKALYTGATMTPPGQL